jgi:SAM-dependent methyltransferase
MPSYRRRDTCRMCAQTRLTRVLELTPTPPGNRVLTSDEIRRSWPAYPLELNFCEACFHVQLGHVVDPSILYQDNYSYVSATSPVFVEHLRQYAEEMVEWQRLAAGELVADIGSNDGTCLSFFKRAGMTVLGIDPATEIAARATASGIETIPDFFNLEVATRLRSARGPARLITSHNACAHIDDLDGLVRGVAHWLADDGVFVVEVGYVVDVFQNLWFDTIYHEHLDYHSVAPFRTFFARNDMELIGAHRIAPQGGSIRLIAQKRGGPREADGSVEALVELERRSGLHDSASFAGFAARLAATKSALLDILGALRASGKRIAGFGAPTKATTLMMHFGIGADILDFIVDENPLKQGKFTPGNHVRIGASEMLYEKRPDYVLILAWNFAESIMQRHTRYAREGGQFIVPMPEPRIVNRTES